MRPFAYYRDPFCRLAVLLYCLNRWGLKPVSGSAFLQGQFNDLWLIPAALPIALWLQRVLGCRRHDLPPSWGEILGHVVIWSLVCEFVGPTWLGQGTGDPWDVLAYASGALAAGVWWNLGRRMRPA